jgi:Carboxypeptidase regulatory-like domain/TonB dependent receptor
MLPADGVLPSSEVFVVGRLTTVAVLVLCCVAGLRAQSTHASLAGRVSDPSKAAIADALVVAISDATNLSHHASTDPSGQYRVRNLPPGSYRIEVEKPGFKKIVKPDVVVHVQDAVEIDFEMALGSIAESITVEAGAPLVNTRSASVSTVIDRGFVERLPLNGRSFQSLITMTPGVVRTPASSTTPGQFSVNGQRSDANYFMVDGVSANVGVQVTAGLGPAGAGAAPGLSALGGTNSLVSVDALHEFRIETSSYAPEFGRLPGGQISIVTRSGTNQFHGSVFEFFRDDALDSADYFVKRQGLSKPQEQQHDFGGVFGGPIERNRMFVFVSFERLRLDQPRTAITEVPSVASRLAASDALKPILTAFPLPNGPETANGLGRFSASYTDPSTLTATSIRVDRSFGSALSAFARYNYAPSEASSRLGSFAAASANTIGWVEQQLQTLTGGVTMIVNPTWANELRVNWSRNVGKNYQTLDAFGGAAVPPATMLHPQFAPPDSVFRVNLSVPNVFFDEGLNSSNRQRQVNIVNAVTMTKARHQVKLGIDYRHLFPIYGPVGYVQSYTFSGVAGVLAGSASALLTAAPSSINRSSEADNFAAYVQDTWSLSPALTLAYGVRWDVNPAPSLSHSDEALTLASADPSSLALAPPGTPLYRTTYGNVAPRVGATYRLRESPRELVVRGGWGIFFDLGSQATMENLANSYPFTARRDFFNVPFPPNPILLTPPTVVPGSQVDFLTAADPNLESPYTHQWNAAIESALGGSGTITASYVGALGRRLLRQERLLNPTPQFFLLTLGTNLGHSRYDALQVKYTRRLSGGWQALTAYTLARSTDNTSFDTLPVLPSSIVDPELDWGPSDFDVRHTLSGGATYIIPEPPAGSIWHALGSGWSINSIFTARSALPVNVATGATVSAVSNALRPDVVPGVPFYVDDATLPGGRGFNRAAFVAPPSDASGNPLRQGTLGRNALRGFAMWQVDFAVHRNVRLGGLDLQFRVESFNVLNRSTFAQPTNAMSSGLFGQPTRTLASGLGGGGVVGGGLSPLYQVGGPRSIQLAARLQF